MYELMVLKVSDLKCIYLNNNCRQTQLKKVLAQAPKL